MATYFLYLKTSPLGLKYLGKTTKDPYIYIGSGKIWKRHIEKHGLTSKDIKTEILFETKDLEEFKKKSIEISHMLNIVGSPDFANLIIEKGDGGDTSKHIDFSNPIFHKSNRADHLNGIGLPREERKKIFIERSKRIDYKDPERLRKIKENTNWEKLLQNRNTDYSKFLDRVHEKNKKSILQLNIDGEIIREWKSAVDAGKELNIKPGTIRSWISCNRIGINSKWIYKKDYENN
jgi:hypothetical protein